MRKMLPLSLTPCCIILLLVTSVFGQENDLCSRVCAYCKTEQGSSRSSQAIPSNAGPPGRTGKAGPRGIPGKNGKPAEVKYNLINSKISERIAEIEARLDQKYAEYDSLVDRLRDRVYPPDCRHVHKFNSHSWNETGGLFNIYPSPISDAMEVYCDLATDRGGWIVFQRRMDGSEDFYRGWNDYVNGFGDKEKEFWLGLEKIHQLSKNGNYELRVDMKDWNGNAAYAKYGSFAVGSSATNYKLIIGKYSGNAGDALGHEQHKNRPFTTKDADHDSGGGNCAVTFHAAFWYGACHATNPNGRYIKGGNTEEYAVSVVWAMWKGHNYSLKFIEMKIRPK